MTGIKTWASADVFQTTIYMNQFGGPFTLNLQYLDIKSVRERVTDTEVYVEAWRQWDRIIESYEKHIDHFKDNPNYDQLKHVKRQSYERWLRRCADFLRLGLEDGFAIHEYSEGKGPPMGYVLMNDGEIKHYLSY